MSSSMQAYAKAASRISTKLSPSALSKIGNDIDRIVSGAPASAFAVPESVRSDPFVLNNPDDGSPTNPYEHTRLEHGSEGEHITHENPGAVVRKVGTSRRVFLLNPALTPQEIDGLAYRIRTLSSNSGINSIVVANPMEDAECNGDMSENSTCVPSFMEEDDPGKDIQLPGKSMGPYGNKTNFVKSVMYERFGDGLGMPYVASGYDAQKVYEEGLTEDKARLDHGLLTPLVGLARAVRGSYDENIEVNNSPSKVPVVSLPHGLVTDGGYSLCLGSYVLATHSTSFRVLNPLRGLAFDPVGLSYLLPRVGWEFRQASSQHSKAIAMILALTGYEACAEDMVATGLATHYIGGPFKLNMLERALSDLNSYENSALYANFTTFYGREDEREDINVPFYNVAVANLIQYLSEYDAAGAGEYGCKLQDDLDDETGLFLKNEDPSLTMQEERIQMYGELQSDLVDWGSTFGDVFDEKSVGGMMERLREIGATKAEFEGRSGCEEHVMVAEQAQMFVENMEKRSPLALRVMHQLLMQGMENGETLDSCMEREKESQLRMFTKKDGDFACWAQSGKGVGLVEMLHGNSSLVREREDVFSEWAHSSVDKVTDDEVREIVGN